MKILESCTIGSLPLKNRMVMAPMSLNLAEDGLVTERMIRFFSERAKGGVGLITIGDGIVDTPLGNNVLRSTAVDHDRCIPRLKDLTEAVHAFGAKVAMQLSHGGRRAGRISRRGFPDVTRGLIPVAPSSLPHPVPGQVVPRPLTGEEIQEIVEKFGQAARRCLEAGFDAIGLHCAHMYLCGQFLSPWANQREDEYGGDFERRLRFVLEVVHRIRKETGEDHPLILRMNGEEPEGGNSLLEIQEMAQRFQQAGADALHVSVGFGAPAKTRGLTPSVTPMRAPAGCIVHLAENIKKRITIPVIAVNKLGDIPFAERVLQESRADLIALGRPLIADPYLPLKVSERRISEIRPCIYCCVGCIGNVLEKDEPVACSVNPMAGREMEGPVLRARESKRVLIVGAGPAGMQAALTAAERGHRVCLVERAHKMGGQLQLAAAPPGKAPIRSYLRFLETQVRKADIRIELGSKVTPRLLDEVGPDAAILAMGSRPVLPRIDGLSTKSRFTAREVLEQGKLEGKRVLVIGGGQVGCEVAEYLAEQGKDVTIVEALRDVASDMERINRLALIMSLEDHGVRLMTKSAVDSVSEEGATVSAPGRTERIVVDALVIAVGSEPCKDAVESLIEDRVETVIRIGDQEKARGILEAVREGFEAALRV